MAQEHAFTVMTANVVGQERYGFGERKEAAYEIFKGVQVDIVGFQELGLSTWEEVFGKAQPDLKIVHGKPAGDIAVNSFAYRPSRFECLMSDTVWLTPDGKFGKAWGGVERGMTWGEMKDLATGRTFLFINAHFDNKSAEARIQSVKFILKWVEAFGKIPIIFTADSNISIDSPHPWWQAEELRKPYTTLIDAGFEDSWYGAHPSQIRPFTFHNFRGHEYSVMSHDKFGTYDTEWILTRGSFQALDCHLVTDSYNGVYPSDHFWMVAELLWK